MAGGPTRAPWPQQCIPQMTEEKAVSLNVENLIFLSDCFA